MTSLVGIYCKDGVVIGADSSTTFSNGIFSTMEQPSSKILILQENLILAGTGAVGLGQRFAADINEQWAQIKSQSGITISKALSNIGLQDFAQTFLKPGQYGALFAYPAEGNHFLCEFDVPNFQPEHKTEKLWYASMGSAQSITDPFLGFIRKIFWEDGCPSINDAIFAAYWTLQQAIDLNPGGVNGPISIAVLEKKEANYESRILDHTELLEHSQNLRQAETALRDYRKSFQIENKDIPEIPKA